MRHGHARSLQQLHQIDKGACSWLASSGPWSLGQWPWWCKCCLTKCPSFPGLGDPFQCGSMSEPYQGNPCEGSTCLPQASCSVLQWALHLGCPWRVPTGLRRCRPWRGHNGLRIWLLQKKLLLNLSQGLVVGLLLTKCLLVQEQQTHSHTGSSKHLVLLIWGVAWSLYHGPSFCQESFSFGYFFFEVFPLQFLHIGFCNLPTPS